MYDCDLKKGIKKKSLPEPNPTKVEVESNSSLLEVQKRAKELYFKKYTTPPEMLLMGDSSGVPILRYNMDYWYIFFRTTVSSPADTKCTLCWI